MMQVPPNLMPQQQQGLLTQAPSGGTQPLSQESLLLAAGDMQNQGLLAQPRKYDHAAHMRHHYGQR